MGRRRRQRSPEGSRPDPFAVLGLAGDPTIEQVENARRALAKSAHPDVGGSLAEMQRINAAADEATRILLARTTAAPPPSPAPAPPQQAASTQAGPPLQWRIDHPSFTVEALPVEAFEGLLLVAGWLGETIDDDPPYRLDVELGDPFRCWCRLELVPDAGATTVSLAVIAERGVALPEVEAVRDAWIEGLNSLDWAALGDFPPPP